MPRRVPFTVTLLLIAALGLVSFACEENDEDGAASPTATTIAAAETPTAPAGETPSGTPFSGSREPVEKPAGNVPVTPLLASVEITEHDGFDRIVFDFDGTLPGYRVEYVDAALGCGSGEPVEIEGAALLQVRMAPAAAHDEAGAPTFAQQELMPGLPSVLEAEQTCDFEADVTWVIGLAQVSDFRVDDAADTRTVIVVDVASPSERPPPTEP